MDRVFIYIDKIRAQGKTKTLKMKWKKKILFHRDQNSRLFD